MFEFPNVIGEADRRLDEKLQVEAPAIMVMACRFFLLTMASVGNKTLNSAGVLPQYFTDVQTRAGLKEDILLEFLQKSKLFEFCPEDQPELIDTYTIHVDDLKNSFIDYSRGRKQVPWISAVIGPTLRACKITPSNATGENGIYKGVRRRLAPDAQYHGGIPDVRPVAEPRRGENDGMMFA